MKPKREPSGSGSTIENSSRDMKRTNTGADGKRKVRKNNQKKVVSKILVKCSWCGALMSDDGINDNRISHGICPECKAEYFGEFLEEDE